MRIFLLCKLQYAIVHRDRHYLSNGQLDDKCIENNKKIAFGKKVSYAAAARSIYLAYVGFWCMVGIYLVYTIHTILYGPKIPSPTGPDGLGRVMKQVFKLSLCPPPARHQKMTSMSE